jgi:hypothetical protein
MRPWRNRKYNVAAIELATGQQVQRSRKHSHPRGNGNGMQADPAQWNIRQRTRASNRDQQFANELKD